jgi:hypothetical protein
MAGRLRQGGQLPRSIDDTAAPDQARRLVIDVQLGKK